MAIFDNNKELKAINSAFTTSFELDNIQSFLDDAIIKEITPAIGSATYTQLLSEKQGGISEGSSKAQLLHLLQKACLSIALGNYAAFGSLQIQDSGITVLSRENARPASDAKVTQLRKQSLSEGFDALELAIEFLEAHISEFPVYAISEAHQNNRTLFINSSKEFSEASALPITAQVFNALRSEVARVERDFIEPLIGEPLTDDLHTKIRAKKIEGLDQKLIQRIQRTIAPLSLAGIIPYQLLKMDSLGGFQLNDSEVLSSSNEQKLQMAMFRLNSRGEAELASLTKWLNTNKDAFPSYATGKVSSTNPSMYTAKNVYLI